MFLKLKYPISVKGVVALLVIADGGTTVSEASCRKQPDIYSTLF